MIPNEWVTIMRYGREAAPYDGEVYLSKEGKNHNSPNRVLRFHEVGGPSIKTHHRIVRRMGHETNRLDEIRGHKCGLACMKMLVNCGFM
jgi:hypothetical protein